MASDKTPIHRQEDNELLGYIKPAGNDQWEPQTIFGYPLAAVASRADAIAVLKNRGLDVLMDTWQFYDSSEGDWYNCRIVEAHEDTVRITITDYGHPHSHQTRLLTHPTADILGLQANR